VGAQGAPPHPRPLPSWDASLDGLREGPAPLLSPAAAFSPVRSEAPSASPPRGRGPPARALAAPLSWAAAQGLALLLPPSCELMVERGLLSWLAGSFHRWRADRACSALDALLAMQMRSERAQRQFAEAGGLLKVGRLLTDAQAAPQLKRRGLEFLALLMQEAVPKPTPRHMLRPLENAIGKEAAAKLLERKLNLDESEDDIIRLHTEVAPLLKKGNAVLDWFQQLQA